MTCACTTSPPCTRPWPKARATCCPCCACQTPRRPPPGDLPASGRTAVPGWCPPSMACARRCSNAAARCWCALGPRPACSPPWLAPWAPARCCAKPLPPPTSRPRKTRCARPAWPCIRSGKAACSNSRNCPFLCSSCHPCLPLFATRWSRPACSHPHRCRPPPACPPGRRACPQPAWTARTMPWRPLPARPLWLMRAAPSPTSTRRCTAARRRP